MESRSLDQSVVKESIDGETKRSSKKIESDHKNSEYSKDVQIAWRKDPRTELKALSVHNVMPIASSAKEFWAFGLLTRILLTLIRLE
ncbi:Hypothetical predicted protein [Cloeon dipterum]|uniref:Uncharacterized protein n=1 Tax=Cloeon dipterum TaxID=197152 RepID=A0A8S1DE42_9INSE|nr:Hypothetical predicted protein [Cloeon dipterum]